MVCVDKIYIVQLRSEYLLQSCTFAPVLTPYAETRVAERRAFQTKSFQVISHFGITYEDVICEQAVHSCALLLGMAALCRH
jgi:hypothetical protein